MPLSMRFSLLKCSIGSIEEDPLALISKCPWSKSLENLKLVQQSKHILNGKKKLEESWQI